MDSPDLIQHDDDSSLWRLQHPYSVDVFCRQYTVEPPFDTDLASIPSWAWSLVGAPSHYSGPAVIHDDLCRRCSTYQERCAADGIFFLLLHQWSKSHKGKPGYCVQWMMYAALRLHALCGNWRQDCSNGKNGTDEMAKRMCTHNGG